MLFLSFTQKLKKNEYSGVYQIFNPSNAEASVFQSTMTQNILKPSKPCHVGTHWIASVEYSQMGIHVPGFQSFFRVFLHNFVLAKLDTSIIRANETC